MTLSHIRTSITMACLALSGAIATAQEPPPASPQAFDAALLVRTEENRLTLATAASRDVRNIRLEDVDEITDVQVAQSATKAVVLTRSRRLQAFDLSNDSPILRPYATWPLGTPSPSPARTGSHSVRSARFSFVVDGALIVVDESLAPIQSPGPTSGLVAAETRSAACLLTVSRDGMVRVTDLTSGSEIATGRIAFAPTDDVDIVSAPLPDGQPCRNEDNLGFVIVVHGTQDSSLWTPRGESLRTTTRVDALKVAATLAGIRRFDDAVADYHCGTARCEVALIRPDVNLYLPVLEMAAQETVWPSSVTVWRHLSRDPKRDAEFRDQGLPWWSLYEQYAARFAKKECVVYSRTMELRRSWLIQYWLYFPFDLGNRSPHAHDTEHVFVEVDKRGGRIARVLGDGHGLVSGNNLYSAELDTGYALTLPVYAFVELGKHATAPDTDKNGFFTPGVDENHYNERSKVWGVRDVIGSINNELLVYDASMTIPRTSASRYGHADFAALFPGSAEVPASNRICKVEEWQPAPAAQCPDKDDLDPAALEACGKAKIQHHSDFVDPNGIFKNELFPAFSFRVVVGRAMDGLGRSLAFQLAGEINEWPVIRKLPMTGRFSIAMSIRRLPDPNPLIAQRRFEYVPIFGYERFVTNLVGFTLHAGGWDDGVLGAGLFVEAPLGRTGLNLNFKVGPTVIGGGKTQMGASLALGLPLGQQHRFR